MAYPRAADFSGGFRDVGVSPIKGNRFGQTAMAELVQKV